MSLLKKLGGGKGPTGNDPKSLWEAFFHAAMKNDWKTASTHIERLVALEPNNSQAFMKQGDVLQRVGKSAEAVHAYHQAAWLLSEDGETQKALAIYKIIMRIDPADEEAVKRSRALIQGYDTASEAAPVPRSDENEQYEESPEAESYEDDGGSIEIAGQEDASTEPATQRSTPHVARPQTSSAPKKPADLKEAFSRHPIFSALNHEDILSIPKRARLLRFENGAAVIKEDEPGDSMFIIKRGKALVTSEILDRKFNLAALKTWDFFGEAGFLTGMPRTATVTAEGPLEVFEISKELVQELIEKNPIVLQRLVQLSHVRAKRTQDRMGGDA